MNDLQPENITNVVLIKEDIFETPPSYQEEQEIEGVMTLVLVEPAPVKVGEKVVKIVVTAQYLNGTQEIEIDPEDLERQIREADDNKTHAENRLNYMNAEVSRLSAIKTRINS